MYGTLRNYSTRFLYFANKIIMAKRNKTREEIIISRIRRLVDLKSSWVKITKYPEEFISQNNITDRTFLRDKKLLQDLGLFRRANGRISGKNPDAFNKIERLVDVYTCGILGSGDLNIYTARYGKGHRTARRDVELLKKCFPIEMNSFYKWREEDGI
jgi:hypothetical protein